LEEVLDQGLEEVLKQRVKKGWNRGRTVSVVGAGASVGAGTSAGAEVGTGVKTGAVYKAMSGLCLEPSLGQGT
jgi:hypothetical protein